MDTNKVEALASGPKESPRRPPLGEFLPPIVIPPLSSVHKFTIIFLHGRGSNAKKFHAPLLSMPAPDGATFQEALANTKFVFPTAPLMRATKYRRTIIHQWYDGTGDWEPEARGEMRPSVEYIHELLRKEIRLVGGNARRVVLAGISQGCAMSLTSLLLWEGDPLGAVVVMCGFMPLNASLMSTLEEGESQGEEDDIMFETEMEDDIFESDSAADDETPLHRAIEELREEAELPSPTKKSTFPFLSTPIFIGHGVKDDNVEYKHGKLAAELLQKMGATVDFHTYPELGHWYSPEMLGNIVTFLSSKVGL
ncbi:hypothetical protein G7046_g5686 [Stylonectria norvegica]|nr:hypothetical protein G7046_g5686 [Stylonectria norvegica]